MITASEARLEAARAYLAGRADAVADAVAWLEGLARTEDELAEKENRPSMARDCRVRSDAMKMLSRGVKQFGGKEG